MTAIMWGDVPIPYTAYWSDELPVDRWTVRRVPQFGNRPFLVEVDSKLTGKPRLSLFHCGRALEVMTKNWCQICREPLSPPAYCIGFGRKFNGLPHITDGLPMCTVCTKLSLVHCPTLRERVGDKSLQLYVVHGWQLCPATMGENRDGHAGINEALRRWKGQRPVFGHPKIVLTRFSTVDAAEFLAEGVPS